MILDGAPHRFGLQNRFLGGPNSVLMASKLDLWPSSAPNFDFLSIFIDFYSILDGSGVIFGLFFDVFCYPSYILSNSIFEYFGEAKTLLFWSLYIKKKR